MLVDNDYADSQVIVRSCGPVIAVQGEVDSSNCATLETEIKDRLARIRVERVELDLSDLYFLGSAGIRVLLRCREIAEEHGSRLEISRAHENVSQVLAICGLAELFHLPPASPQPPAEEESPRFWAPWW